MSSWHRHVAAAAGLVAALAAAACGARVVAVKGDSMAPGLKDGDRILLNTSAGALARGDVVAYRSQIRPQASHLSRVVVLPGEVFAIRKGVLHVGGKPLDEPYVAPENRSADDYGPYKVPAGAYFLLGDNRRNSMDSRTIGAVARDRIWGRWAW
jgi:signal peptidase I